MNIEKPDYEKIMWGNSVEKITVARIFYENMKILDKIREKKITLRFQVTDLYLVCSIMLILIGNIFDIDHASMLVCNYTIMQSCKDESIQV